MSLKLKALSAAAVAAPIEAVAYVGMRDTDKILAINITDPSNMSVISEVSLNTPADFALDADRNILFAVSTLNKRVYAYDISDPTQITLLDNKVVTTSNKAKALGYDPVNERLLISTQTIVDVSNPNSMFVALTNTYEYKSSRYVRQHSTSGTGIFAQPFAGPPNDVRSIEVTSSTVSIEDDFSARPDDRPDGIAADETNNLLFSCSGDISINAVSNTAIFSPKSSVVYNDGVFCVAVSPSDLRAYAFIELSNGTRRMATFSYNSDGTGLTFIRQTSSFGIQTQAGNSLHVNSDRGVLGMTKSNLSGASDLTIYGLADPSDPAFQGSITLAASGEYFSFVRIQNYPIP